MIRTPIRRLAGLGFVALALNAGPVLAQDEPPPSGFEMTDEPATATPSAAPPAQIEVEPTQPAPAPPPSPLQSPPSPPPVVEKPSPPPQAPMPQVKPEPSPAPAKPPTVEPASPQSPPPVVPAPGAVEEAPPPLLDPGITTEALEAMTALPGSPSTFEGTVLNRLDGSEEHSALAGAIRAANAGEKFVGAGPITVFAPTNAAFQGLPPKVVELMLKPENAARLAAVLDFHRVAGRLTADDLAAMADLGGGLATLTTLQGGVLTVVKQDGRLILRDAKGGEALIGGPAIEAVNGLILPVDTVLMP